MYFILIFSNGFQNKSLAKRENEIFFYKYYIESEHDLIALDIVCKCICLQIYFLMRKSFSMFVSLASASSLRNNCGIHNLPHPLHGTRGVWGQTDERINPLFFKAVYFDSSHFWNIKHYQRYTNRLFIARAVMFNCISMPNNKSWTHLLKCRRYSMLIRTKKLKALIIFVWVLKAYLAD